MENNEKTFTRLLMEHKSDIYTICYMFSDSKEQVEDLFQEICLRLWKGFGTFREECSMRTWVWRIATNTCITWQKQEQRARTPLEISIDLFTPNKEETAQIRMLHDRIHRLGAFDRAIVMLWLEDMSYDEIAQITGLTVSNVGVRLVRIKEQLKQMSNH